MNHKEIEAYLQKLKRKHLQVLLLEFHNRLADTLNKEKIIEELLKSPMQYGGNTELSKLPLRNIMLNISDKKDLKQFCNINKLTKKICQDSTFQRAWHVQNLGYFPLYGTDNYNYLAWSPDGTKIVSTSGYPLHIWDVSKGSIIAEVLPDMDYSSKGISVTWSPDGTKIAYSGSGRLEIIDATNTKILKTVQNNIGSDVAWSHDGKKIATTGRDSTIRIWDAATLEMLKTLIDPDWIPGGELYRGVKWSSDNKRLATGTVDGFQIWDSETGKLLYNREDDPKQYNLDWSPDGTKLATIAFGDENIHIQIWNVKTLQEIGETHILSGYSDKITWSPDGTMLATIVTLEDLGGYAEGYLLVLDPKTKKHLRLFEMEITIRPDNDELDIAWSPDSKSIAVSKNDEIRIYDI